MKTIGFIFRQHSLLSIWNEYNIPFPAVHTNKQLNLSLQIQGLIFTVGTICVALAAGLPLGYALFSYAKHNGI